MPEVDFALEWDHSLIDDWRSNLLGIETATSTDVDVRHRFFIYLSLLISLIFHDVALGNYFFKPTTVLSLSSCFSHSL